MPFVAISNYLAVESGDWENPYSLTWSIPSLV